MIIDLHCHTNCSDNSYSIEDVLKLAAQNNISKLAITDHDTTIGLERAIALGKDLSIDIIPGIEISAYDYKRNRRTHILGLFVASGHPALEALCRPMREERHNASRLMTRKLIQAGYHISWEQVLRLAENGTGVYKQHIMHALILNGYTDSIYGPLYKKLFFRGDRQTLPGLAFVPVHYLDAIDAIHAIRKAGGVPVLAHPGQFDNFSAVPEFVEAGLGGIEVFHPLHDAADEKKAMQLAETYHLAQTGGSDFHGYYTDTGSVPGSRSIDRDRFALLEEKRDQTGKSIQS
ncbi:PHP domain-containing protein [Sporolactobacillus shoreicorticis]|uniref:PHP domain-containing protein n=1 Tax=Sporolactobacillus shoreicorticis TaxID=1923877 RepID=A0ABW5S1B3_9BACL|nr:PHP domain-containing protein [Sporolactobacillus shoreicorticis]MCO7125257.1 PHP domain-containing protein [Sporolactobacillus shoreicorticis]